MVPALTYVRLVELPAPVWFYPALSSALSACARSLHWLSLTCRYEPYVSCSGVACSSYEFSASRSRRGLWCSRVSTASRSAALAALVVCAFSLAPPPLPVSLGPCRDRVRGLCDSLGDSSGLPLTGLHFALTTACRASLRRPHSVRALCRSLPVFARLLGHCVCSKR